MKKYCFDNPEDSGICLECGESFTPTRPNMKFCSGHCRYEYHNRANSLSVRARSHYLSQIDKNYEILRSVLKSGITEMPLSDLVTMGFKPGCVTSFTKARSCVVLCIFDIHFRQSESRIYDIGKVSLNLRAATKKSKV